MKKPIDYWRREAQRHEHARKVEAERFILKLHKLRECRSRSLGLRSADLHRLHDLHMWMATWLKGSVRDPLMVGWPIPKHGQLANSLRRCVAALGRLIEKSENR